MSRWTRHVFPALLPLLALPLLAGRSPAPAPPAPAGTIEGRVTLGERPTRRVASRYPGQGGGAAHVMGAVPAVAYLVGPVAGAGNPAPAARPRLTQRDTSFRPPVLVVPVGTAVEFPNADAFFHNVFSYSAPKRFDLGRYPRGESRTVVFDRPGIVKVYCEIHQWMRAAVVVVENPFHAQVGADGRFSIGGVPPGRYRLAVWDFDRGQRTVEVAVPASGAVRVDVRL
ncbi:MAG TPA: carboxypeptidase regulatory-like domain-containing protein [Longimicrobiaceae bacterium]|nr:carboxypeptidase regulatory-like domain-containing protein [Longimicrobiaceae bacterium]